jgi:exportin-1
MIAKMAKPEEVLIVEDENGQIIREPMKDTDSIVLYALLSPVCCLLSAVCCLLSAVCCLLSAV